ncbi:MAG: MG2 domain-containing protein [Elusimicrobiales bacterium]|nr:MG2 domain-containing protein [Elusimicrobiales bacterium]
MKAILAIFLFPCFASAAGELQKADQLFSKNLYQEALTIYSSAAAVGQEDGLKALYRSAECESLLFRYGEAAQRLSDMKLPPDSLWQGRFLLLRAETGRLFLRQYGYSLPADIQKGVKDVTKLTSAQWRGLIEADYNSLWDLRGELLKYRLEGQDYFMDLKGAELAYTPTLWDFAVLRWTSYLLDESEAGGALPPADRFAESAYSADYSASAAAALKAAAIFEDAAGMSSSSMDFAREYWRLQRLLIPFEHGNRVAPFDRAALRGKALGTLNGWAASFKTALARSWALYHAAALHQEAPDYKAAVELCKKAEAEAPRSKPAILCSKIRAEIEMPSLELSASFAPPPGLKTLRVNVRNLPSVYFKAYKTSPQELSSIGQYGDQAWGRVKYLQQEAVKNFLARSADLEWQQKISYPAPYQYKDQDVAVPGFKKGLYIVIASGDSGFEDGSSLIKAVTLNITDIFLLGTSGIKGDPEDFLYDPLAPGRQASSDVFRLYAVNALTGKPLAGADIDVFYHRSNYGSWQKAALKSGPDGAAPFAQTFPVSYPSNEYFSLDPLLSVGGAYAYWNSQASAGLNVPQPVSIFVETDRPVYRPGQEVKFKATALLREPRGFRVYDGKGKLSVTARDPNWQEVYKKTLPFTGLGSAAGSFKIPEGRLLGGYSVTAQITEYGYNFSGAAGFGVEEYKRPEFEVKLGEAKKPYRYGEKAEVSGDVKYYFGSPVPGAAVKYRITRSRYIPWYCRYWSWFYGASGSSEVASGEIKTGDDGKFSFSFTPQAESAAYAAYPSSYQVEAEARDAGGRTITDSRSYRAGSKAYLFDIKPDAGFFTPEKSAVVNARLMDLNDIQQAGAGEYALYRLEKAPSEEGGRREWGYFGNNPSLEQAFSQVPDGPQAGKGKVEFLKDGAAKISFKSLAPGVYRLKLKASDPWGGESESQLIIISASAEGRRNAGLKLPPVALFEHDSYQAGETARALIGASSLKGVKYVEILAGSFMLSRETLQEGGLSVYSLKVSAEHRGGFGLRWLGAGDFKVYSAMDGAEVPLKDKNISLSLDYDKVLAPGQRASWLLKAKDSAGRPAFGEALVKIFDRSLEYYGRDAGFWGDGLYPARRSSGEGWGSLFTPYAVALPIRTGLIQRMLEAFRLATGEEHMASLRIGSSRLYGRNGGIGAFRGSFAKSLAFEGDAESLSIQDAGMASMSGGAASNLAEAAAPGMAIRDTSRKSKADSAPASAPERKRAEPEVKTRTDFSETAYYNPQLKVSKGSGRFSFTIPERLTSWKISSYLLTKSARRGSFSAEAVTKKDLMVRLDIPRFFREGDSSRLTAVITNDTAGQLSGEVSLSVTLDGEAAHDKFGLKDLSRPFTVKPNGTMSVYWEMLAPRGTAAYKVRAVARAGALADAQENDLPVLPSRERLIASGVASLDGNSSKTFKLPELEAADPTREVESLHLEIQPQLILTVLNSLPFLVHYPYECTEQLLNRYVPLAITNSFYNKYPELRASVAKIPKRTTITPEWERDNPVRLMSLMETPWEQESKGRKSYWPVVDMLDPKVVSGEKEDAVSKLKAYQHPDGSFPWFPGGRPNLHMTLYVLEGLAEAARYGVDIPQDTAKKALSYVLGEIPSHMKPEEDQTSLVLYAAYVVTSFPASWPESKTALTYAKAWVDYADKHSNAMTAFGKAYAAYVYLRLGDKVKAESYLARAMDGARTDDIAGVYWTPEKISWLWYNDTVEKHAFILRTLLAVRPKDPKIAGLVRWLLFNRKANEWKSTKASAAAIYSLLDVMKSKGALDKAENFDLKWGNTSESVQLQPFDWVAKPLRWSKYGAEITKKDLSPIVEKKGPGLAFAAFTGIYTTDKTAEESPSGMMNVSRKYFLREKEGDSYTLKPLADGDTVAVGDQIEVQLTVNTRSQFEYVHLKDPKAAGFEAETLTSGWQWDQLGRYEEPRDSLTNFFMEWLPHGEYVLKYRLRPTTPGTFKAGAAVIQSMYAPEFAAHSSGITLNVK